MGSESINETLASEATRPLHTRLRERQTTKSVDEIPLLFREKYLLSGYRFTGKSWTYYLKSFLHIHNETGNVWSHFIAIFIFVYKVYELSSSFVISEEPITWPILGFLLGTIMYALLSTFAHLFHSKSSLIHYTCFQIDYIGIGLNSFGTGCLVYYSTGSKAYYEIMPPILFMSINTLMAVVVCVTCSVAKLRYNRPYPVQRVYLQFASVGSHVVFGTIPLFCFSKNCLVDDPDCTLSHIFPHLHAFFWFGLSVYFFASAMPEKIAPGRFDIMGHGHQIFHVLMIITSLLQFHSGLIELQRRPRDLVAMSAPDAMLIFGCILTVIVLDAIFVIFTHKYRVDKVAQNILHEKEIARKLVNKCQ